MTLACTGIGIGSGVAIGNAYLLRQGRVQLAPEQRHVEDIAAEVARYRAAVIIAEEQLHAIRGEISTDLPEDIVEFIDTHLLMLQDKVITEGPVKLIRQQGLRAELALQDRRDALVAIFDRMDDPYLRTRKDDLDHVVQRIQRVLAGEHREDTPSLEGRIVLADDITPADAVLLKQRGVAGFVTEYGSPMSHTAILARSLGIPAVVGTHGAMACLRHGELLILDAEQGVVLADSDPRTRHHFEQRLALQHARLAELKQLLPEAARSLDGEDFMLLANIELPGDVAEARDNGAQGVGLFRTEFLYMNRSEPPDEEEQFAAYRDAVTGMNGLPVTVRTLDLGADKAVTGASPGGNPALGLRGIRLCLKEPTLFRPQLRALLRAAALGPLRIMLPMVTTVWEVLHARALIEDVSRELQAEDIPHAPDVPVGAMIEVPAAALAAPLFARELDFLSIGTNDLIQYTLAIDRVDDAVAYLYDPLHPAVVQLLQHVIAAGNDAHIPVSMCGEMAGDPSYVPLLAGLGLRHFSMQPGALLAVKERIRAIDTSETHQLVARRLAGQRGDPA
jgi:phosphotransferase system enzyme I (PtsI)